MIALGRTRVHYQANDDAPFHLDALVAPEGRSATAPPARLVRPPGVEASRSPRPARPY